MTAVRFQFVVRLMACMLLIYAAADLLVPALCDAEQVVIGQEDGTLPSSHQDTDCFCCCSHIKTTQMVVVLSDAVPVIVEQPAHDNLVSGAPRSLYHPPLHS